MLFDIVRCCWVLFGGCWVVLDAIGRCWMLLGVVVHCTSLDGVDSVGRCSLDCHCVTPAGLWPLPPSLHPLPPLPTHRSTSWVHVVTSLCCGCCWVLLDIVGWVGWRLLDIIGWVGLPSPLNFVPHGPFSSTCVPSTPSHPSHGDTCEDSRSIARKDLR